MGISCLITQVVVTRSLTWLVTNNNTLGTVTNHGKGGGVIKGSPVTSSWSSSSSNFNFNNNNFNFNKKPDNSFINNNINNISNINNGYNNYIQMNNYNTYNVPVPHPASTSWTPQPASWSSSNSDLKIPTSNSNQNHNLSIPNLERNWTSSSWQSSSQMNINLPSESTIPNNKNAYNSNSSTNNSNLKIPGVQSFNIGTPVGSAESSVDVRQWPTPGSATWKVLTPAGRETLEGLKVMAKTLNIKFPMLNSSKLDDAAVEDIKSMLIEVWSSQNKKWAVTPAVSSTT